MTSAQKPDAERLSQAIETLNTHKFMKMHESLWRLLWFNFLRGLAFGLGSVLGATFLVYVLLQILAQIEFIPLFGDWAVRLIGEIEKGR